MTRRKINVENDSQALPERNLSKVDQPHPSPPDEASHYSEELKQAESNSMPKHDSHLIQAKLLIPGKGKPLQDVSVITQDGVITFVGASRKLPPEFEKLPTTKVEVLMPGMWDCHTHLIGAESLNFQSIVTTPAATAGARLARSCHDILMSGFTSVRDLGGWACEISQAVDEGTIAGPHIYSAGAALSQTAGHGDVFDLPVGWAWSRLGVGKDANGGNVGAIPLCLADGVDEVRKAVRLQIRRGAKVIKVLASGGVLSIADDPLLQQFSDEELSTIVSEAGRMGRIVAAHVHVLAAYLQASTGKDGILAAIRAGCKTLEHGTYLDEECVELMKKHDVMLVATRTIVKEGVKHPELMSPESYKKMVETAKWHLQAYKLAIKSGVKIALGTDLGISIPNQSLSLGKSGGELLYAVEAGMTPLEAIESATANGPLTLGEKMAPKSGQIKVGYNADFVGLDESPLDDIKMLADADNVKYVWKMGKLCKGPSMLKMFN